MKLDEIYNKLKNNSELEFCRNDLEIFDLNDKVQRSRIFRNLIKLENIKTKYRRERGKGNRVFLVQYAYYKK